MSWVWAVGFLFAGIVLGMATLLAVLSSVKVGAQEDEVRRRWLDDQYRREREEDANP